MNGSAAVRNPSDNRGGDVLSLVLSSSKPGSALCEPERNCGSDSAEANRTQDSIIGVSAVGHSLRDVRRMIPGELDDTRLSWVMDSFLAWTRVYNYVSFYGSEKDEFLQVFASKRGNWVYKYRVEERLIDSSEWLLNTRVMDKLGVRNIRPGKYAPLGVGNVLFITLTSQGKKGRRMQWEEITKAYNRFISAFRKRYGITWVIRCIESTELGYPHIHLLLACESSFEVFSHTDQKGKQSWRVQDKRNMQGLWPAYMDVKAVCGGVHGIKEVRRYLFADLLKQTRADLGKDVISQANATLAMNWFFRKRSFGVSGKAVRDKLLEFINDVHNSNRICQKSADLELLDSKKLLFLGCVRLDLQGEAPFMVVLPGGLVRVDDRFKHLRYLLECKQPVIKLEPLPDWSGWNDARCVPISEKLLQAIHESERLGAESMPAYENREDFKDILGEQLCSEAFKRHMIERKKNRRRSKW